MALPEPTDLPPPPEPPLPGDCCGNGCSPCVWDLHAEAMADWRRRVGAARGAARGAAEAGA